MLGNEAVELPDDLGIETSNQTTLCTIIYVDIYIYIILIIICIYIYIIMCMCISNYVYMYIQLCIYIHFKQQRRVFSIEHVMNHEFTAPTNVFFGSAQATLLLWLRVLAVLRVRFSQH